MSQKPLWAPWRMEYLSNDPSAPKATGCVFCNALEKSEDRENLILFRGESAFVILNKFPYNNGHLMVIPNRHTADYLSFSEAEFVEMHQLMQTGVEALKQALHPCGFNMGMNLGSAGGAGIREHLHMHIVPRWTGDTNFMPVIAEVKAMPQHLMTSYDQLKPHFEGTTTP